MIAECTGTPSPAEPRRDECPRAQLQPGDAWHFLHPVVDFSKQRGVKLEPWHKHTLSHTHSQRLPLRRVLFSDILQGFSFLASGDLKLEGDFTVAGREEKTDGQDGQCRCGACSGRLGVCLRGAQQCCWTSRERTKYRPTSRFTPTPAVPNTANMIFFWIVLVLFFSGRSSDFFKEWNWKVESFVKLLYHTLCLDGLWLAT